MRDAMDFLKTSQSHEMTASLDVDRVVRAVRIDQSSRHPRTWVPFLAAIISTAIVAYCVIELIGRPAAGSTPAAFEQVKDEYQDRSAVR